MNKFEPISGLSAEEIKAIGVPLVQCIADDEDSKKDVFEVEEAFIPVCPYQESFNGCLYTFTNKSTKNFILHSLISMLYRDMSHSSENDKSTTEKKLCAIS